MTVSCMHCVYLLLCNITCIYAFMSNFIVTENRNFNLRTICLIAFKPLIATGANMHLALMALKGLLTYICYIYKHIMLINVVFS